MPAIDVDRHKRAEEFNTLVGTNIRELREKREVSGVKLAELADISRSHLTRVEHGERGLTFQQAIAIADALGVGVRRLVRETA